MSTRGRSNLPDIEDELLKARLQPLADRVLPGRVPSGVGDPPPAPRPEPVTDTPDSNAPAPSSSTARANAPILTSSFSVPVARNTGIPGYRDAGQTVASAVAAAERVEQTRAARGPRKGVEFLLPDRVVQALKVAAAQDGVTMSVKLLEVLRTAGYPVIDEDFIDLRRLPKR